MDVMPNGDGTWLATCDCYATRICADQQSAWQWLLDHPCVPAFTDTRELLRSDL